jgi:hypothetical protein
LAFFICSGGYRRLTASASFVGVIISILGFLEKFGETSRTCKNGSTAYLASLAAANNGGLLAGSAKPGPTTGYRALARGGRLLTKFGDLVWIEHRHQHPVLRTPHLNHLPRRQVV